MTFSARLPGSGRPRHARSAPAAVAALGVLATLALAPVQAEPAPAASRPGAFGVTAAMLKCRLRVGGAPGDLAVSNRSVTAIVRRADGWLVDFWRNTKEPSTSPQLKSATNVDGQWLMHPIIRDSRGPSNVLAHSVRAGLMLEQ